MDGQQRPWIAAAVGVWIACFGAVHLACGQTPPRIRAQPSSTNVAIRPTTELTQHARFMMEDAELRDVCFIDELQGWAVGDRGAIWQSADGGRSWRLQPSGVDCRLQAVQFLDSQTGWAVGGAIRPYSHRSEAVVLRTLNGGMHWTRIPTPTLPQLKSVKFFSPTRGWAVGSPSAMYGGGVFQTSNGGRKWSPIDAPPAQWLCADFRDDKSGAIAGRDGRLSVATLGGAIKSRTPDLGSRSIRDMALTGTTGGWLVGDGGLVMQTEDGGLSWQLPPRPIPVAALREFDFTTVAAVGDSVWAAGSPGTLVLHSPDGGHRWELQLTGQSLPLEALTFVDRQHGWAVGALGTILATDDGGRTWRRQRSGGTRASVLFLLADEKTLPLELVARLGGDEGYLCAAEIVGRRDQAAREALSAPAEDRLSAAMISVGGAAAGQCWQFPLGNERAQLSEERVLNVWNAAHDGQALPLLEAQLVRAIRTWRPDVIVTHGNAAAGAAEQKIIGRLARRAAQQADDTTIQPQQLTLARLSAWQVKKVFTICDAQQAGDASVAGAALALRLGKSLGDCAAPARGLLEDRVSPAPTLTEFRLAEHRIAAVAARRDFFSGIDEHPGGEARRQLGDAPPGDIAALRRAAQRQRNVEQLIARTNAVAVDDDAWLGQITELTRGMDEAGAARLVYQLGWRYAQSGRTDLAADVFQITAQRYREQPAAEEALAWLICHYTSSEAAWRQRDRSNPQAQPARVHVPVDGPPQGRIAPASFDEPPSPDPPSGASQRAAPRRQFGRAQALFQVLEKTNPALAAEPSLLLAIASAQRVGDDPRRAESLYRQIASASAGGRWADCARAELWLHDPRRQCPKPLAHCVRAGEKPFLDGALDEPIWKSSKPVPLASRYGDDKDWPTAAMLAYDEEFLYVAATCRRVAGVEYPPAEKEKPRQRDAPPGKHDRIELMLDVNRDWNSAFGLVIDHRGWASDAIDEDASWNPAWHVAAGGDERQWIVEAAIPLSELGPRPPQARDVWVVGVRRVVPGAGVQSWPAAADGVNDVSGCGLLVFD